jgi:hypothetical protein
VVEDTTLHEKAIAHPTYARLTLCAGIMVGRYPQAHQFKRVRREFEYLPTRLGRIIKDIRRKIEGDLALEVRCLISHCRSATMSSVGADRRSNRLGVGWRNAIVCLVIDPLAVSPVAQRTGLAARTQFSTSESCLGIGINRTYRQTETAKLRRKRMDRRFGKLLLVVSLID